MKTTVSNYDFHRAFKDCNRADNFSAAGLDALFDYLEEYEQDTGEELELDVIALCCDFTEYESLEAFQKDYGDEYETLDDVRVATTVIEIDDDAFIIQNF